MKSNSLVFVLCAGLILSFSAQAQEMKPDTMMEHKGTGDMMMEHKNMSGMMMKDLGSADSNYDLRFINAMMEHHEGAIVMAQDALKKSKRPEVQKLAKEIITAQQQEIAQMKSWRKEWYNQ